MSSDDKRTDEDTALTSLNTAKGKVLGGILLSLATAVSVSFGFGYALTAARKREPGSFTKGFDSGFSLGIRALAWGSIYAIGGVGILTFGICKALDVHSAKEFRFKMEKFFHSVVPDIPRNNPPGRSDFKSFRDLFEYLEKESPSLPKKPTSGTNDSS